MAVRLAILALLLTLSVSKPAPLTVSAAISLTNALETLAPMYARQGGGEVRFNFAASNTLARQILRGAPVDLFISADEAQIKLVEDAGAIVPGTRVQLLANQLVLLTRGPHSGVHQLRGKAFRRIALADPDAVPAGVYAREVLTREGLWNELQQKLVPVASVRAALAAFDNRSVDAAFVYSSDAIAARTRVHVAMEWPPDAPRIVYPAAVMKASRNQAEATRLLQFLCGDAAAAVFREHRFIPLGCR